jgi:hypothetical protein
MSALEAIVAELKTLSPEKLAEAAGYIHRLKERSEAERQKALDRAYGCLTDAEAEDLNTVIQAHCERVDASQW